MEQKKLDIAELRSKIDEILPKTYNHDADQVAQSLFALIDTNNNGYASLAEIDQGIKSTIKLPQITGLHTILLKAYNKAKTLKRSQNKIDNDYVSKQQFVYVLLYLRIYYQFFIQFSLLDQNDDKQITLQQLQAGKGVLSKWSIDVSDLNATLKQMDKDGKGTISFRELCDWGINKYFALQFTSTK